MNHERHQSQSLELKNRSLVGQENNCAATCRTQQTRYSALEPGKKQCTVIDICVHLDVNVAHEEKKKCDKYFILTSRLQRLYPQYNYNIVPIVVGSTGIIPKSMQGHLEKCGIDKDRISPTIRQLQRKALQGSVKIVKTAMKMRVEKVMNYG